MKKVETADPIRKTPMVRGKYANLLKQGTNIAIIDLDIVDHFPDSESVNNALRAFLAFGKEFASVTSSRRKPTKRAGARSKYEFDPRTGARQGEAVAGK